MTSLTDNFFNIVYGLDSRVKVVWLISSMVLFFIDNSLLVFLIIFASAVMFILSGGHRTIYMKGVKYILVFFLIIFFIAVLSFEQISDIELALFSILKWTGLMLSCIAFFTMTKPFELISALRSFRVPEGFVFALGIGFRFIPIIFEEIEQISMAQRARGLYTGRGFEKIIRLPTIINAMTVPLIEEILRKLWDMWLALNVRGFALGKRRPKNIFRFSIPNFIVLLYSISIIILSLIS